jgi:hypothetical protein
LAVSANIGIRLPERSSFASRAIAGARVAVGDAPLLGGIK